MSSLRFGPRASTRDCLGCKSGALQMLSYCHTYIHTYILQRQVQQKNTRQGSATRFGLTNMFDNDEDDDDGDHDKRMF